jgi:tetratricopeptide (TPR) repeat protein
MLYRAVFLNEVDILFKLRYFIQDLSAEIEKETISEPISVYIGNTIEQSQIDLIEAIIGNESLVTFHQLLFGSTSQSTAIARAKHFAHHSKEFLNIVVRIDFPRAAKCLARLHRNTSSNDDGIDIFINAGVMTKMIGIEKDHEGKGYVVIHLQFVSYADETNLRHDIQVMRSEIQSTSPLFRLARFLLKFNERSFAEDFFSSLVDEDLLIDDTKRQASLSQALELLALIHFQNESFQRASELFLLSLKAYHRILPVDSSDLYPTYRDLGESFYHCAEYQLAIDSFERALDTQIHSNSPNLLFSAFCCFKSGLAYLKRGDDLNAIRALDRAERILQQSGETHHTELISIYESLADNYYNKEKYADAVMYYKKIIAVQQSVEPNDPKDLYASHLVVASIYLKIEKYRNAMIYYEQAFDYARAYLPENHSAFVLLHNNIGFTHYKEKQYSTALNHYSEGISLASECLPDNHALIGALISNTALVYSNLARFDEAIESMEKSIAQFRKTLSDDDAEVVDKRALLDGIKRKKILHDVIGETFQYF